jgi:hypothetical protein
MKRYTFKYVSHLSVVTIGISDDSEFDFGVSVSALSVKTWERIELITYILVGSILVSISLYVLIDKCVRELHKRSHYVLEEEIEGV